MAFVIADRVKETSTTTGTGALTLAGAITGFRAFSAKCAVGDTVYYAIQGVDAAGGPSGEWECGLGTYSGANTLTRTTVTSSSNADAVVTLSAGTKQVFITMPAAQVAWARERLTAARTYYVATTGSNSNDGLTAGTPFLTIQKAVDTIANTLSLQGYAVTVQVADGTYTATTSLPAYEPGAGTVTIQGNSGTPANVLISTTSASCFTASRAGAVYTIKDMKVQTTTGGSGFVASGFAVLSYGNIVFGACVTAHVYAATGGTITATSAYSIVGGASFHIYVQGASNVTAAKAVTITGTPAFSTAYVYATACSFANLSGATYTGTATGSYYNATTCSWIQSGTQLPGNSAGATSLNGVYS